MDKAAQSLRRRQLGEDKEFNYLANSCVCDPLDEHPNKNPTTGLNFAENDPNQEQLKNFCAEIKGLETVKTESWSNPCEDFISKNPQAQVERGPVPDDIYWKAMAQDCLSRRIKKGKNPYNREAPVPASLNAWAETNAENLITSYLVVVWSDYLEQYFANQSDPAIKMQAARITRTLNNAGYDTDIKRHAIVDIALKLNADIKKKQEQTDSEIEDSLIALGKYKLYLYEISPYKIGKEHQVPKSGPDTRTEVQKTVYKLFAAQKAAIAEVGDIFKKYPQYSDFDKDSKFYKAQSAKRQAMVKRVYESVEEDDDFKDQVQKDKDELDSAKKRDLSQKQQKPEAPAPAPKVLSEKDQLKSALKALGKSTLELYDADTYPYNKSSVRYKKDDHYKKNADKYDSDPTFKQKIDALVEPQKAARVAVLNVFKSGEKYPEYYVKAEDDDKTPDRVKLKASNIAKREAIVRETISEMKEQKGGNLLRKYFKM